MKNKIFKFFNRLSYIIPKKKNLYVFILAHDTKRFVGNIKSQILYTVKNHPEIDSVLLTRNKKVFQEANGHHIHVVKNAFLYLFYLFRAKLIFVDGSISFLRGGRYQFVQLWHGAGFKCVGGLRELEGISIDVLKARYLKQYSQCILVAATSPNNAEIQNQSFLTDRAFVSGYPRNDIFFLRNDFKENLITKYNLNGFNAIITYAPTFRDVQTRPPFSSEFWFKLNDILKERNEVLVVKRHPFDEFLKVPDSLSHIKDLSKTIEDTQELLLITDLLITDYSSVSTDFAITNKPIIIYAYDFEAYLESCRKMVYDLEETLPKPFIKTENQLLNALQDRSWFDTPEVKESYKKFRETFHYYLDGHASRRIMEKVLEALGDSRQ